MRLFLLLLVLLLCAVEAFTPAVVNPTTAKPQLRAIEVALAQEDVEGVQRALAALKEDGTLRLYNSTAPFFMPYTLAEMQVATGLRGNILDKLGLNGRRDIDKIATILVGVVIGSFLSSTAIIQTLPGPDIVRWVASAAVSSFPYVFLSLGIAKPGSLQAGIVGVQRMDANFRERLIRHEAGHFLMGHLLGLPVKSYQADAVTNAVEFYDLSSKFRRNFSEDEVLRLAIISLGGIIAECERYGNSEGGYADLQQLAGLLRACDPPLTDREQQVRVRSAAVLAHTYLRLQERPFEALVEAFREKRSVAACIQAIEEATVARQ